MLLAWRMPVRSFFLGVSLLALLSLTACEPTDDGDVDMPDGAAAGVDAAPGTPGLAGYLEPCPGGSDSECEEGLTCFPFNMKGPHCTHSCTVPSDCEAPSTGCSGMGVCKVP